MNLGRGQREKKRKVRQNFQKKQFYGQRRGGGLGVKAWGSELLSVKVEVGACPTTINLQ